MCCRSPPAQNPTAGIDRPRLPFPYVANVCFRCFSRFKGMLQLFLMDVAKVDWDVAYVASVSETCCKRMFKMFHLFYTYVASVLIRMFAYVSYICCNNMFHMFCLFQTYIPSVLSECCICYNDYVASVCSKCFCFSRML
jgi:hypothetical protein